jgi:hypothetical protein
MSSSCSFGAADLQLDSDPKHIKDNGSVAKITPRTHGKIGAPLRVIESAIVSLSAPS